MNLLKRTLVLYPFFLVIHRVLNMVSLNISLITPGDWLRSLCILLASTLLIFLLSRLIVKEWHKAGLITTLLFIIIFIFGDIFDWAKNYAPEFFSHFGTLLKIITSILFFAGGIWFILIKIKSAKKISLILNVVTAGLCIIPVTGIASFILTRQQPLPVSTTIESPEPVIEEIPVKEETINITKPDIYYILLDAYARADILKNYYNFDNSRFINFLRARGFYIASKSYSNYLSTKLVLASIFNYKYLDELSIYNNKKPQDYGPIFEMIKKNRVIPIFKELGYNITCITSSSIGYTAIGGADENIILKSDQFYTNDFESNLMKTFQIENVVDKVLDTKKTKVDFRREQIMYALNALQESTGKPGPKFVYTHIYCPHDTFVFGPNGEKRNIAMPLFNNDTKEERERYINGYTGQVAYLNKQVIRVIRHILDNSKTDPIIILHGDHGNRMMLKMKPENSCIKESFAILNTVYFPNRDYEKFYPSFSPVNFFPVVLSNYFNMDLDLLEDRTFFSHRFGIYNFIEVTDKLDTCTGYTIVQE